MGIFDSIPLAGGISAGIGGIAGALSNIFGKDKKEWTDADLTKMGWKDYNAGEANNFLLRNAANLINRRKQNANAKAAQYGLDPVSSSYQMEDDIMDSVAGQAGDIYTKSIESSQNKAKLLTALNAQEEDDSDIFSDILSGAGLGLNAVSRFYKPMNTGGILPNDPDVPKNKDVYPTMLAKNEGVLNSEAMSLPGVKEFVQRMNKVGLSLRERTPSSAGGHSPLVRGRQHLKDGGVIGEAKKEETTKKKSRKGAGTSLKDRIMDPNYNPGDIMKEVGYDTFHNMMSGAELGGMNPGMLKLAQLNDMLSDKYSKGNIDAMGHRIESGMTFNPLVGLRLRVGNEQANKNSGGVTIYNENDPMDVMAPARTTLHSHDESGLPSDKDILTGEELGSNNYINWIDYDENGKIRLNKFNRKRVGQPVLSGNR